jgi:phosphoribosylformylglycinamidine cyclo-ligase
MCVNDLIVAGAEPLFFLDYFATGKLDPTEAAAVVAGIAVGCKDSGCGLIGGETAEMPSMYSDGEYDVAGFAVGAVRRRGLMPRPEGSPYGECVKAGDVLLGLESSGLHSNGFSLVRKLVEVNGLDYAAPCPFDVDARNASAMVMPGEDAGSTSGMSLGGGLLVPTKIYVKQLVATGILQRQPPVISALAHITGGGFHENIPRVLPDTLAAHVDASAWPLPPVLSWIMELGKLPQAEMLRTFNSGIGMIVVVPAEHADSVMTELNSYKGDASSVPSRCFRIGTLEVRPTPEAPAVVVTGQLGGCVWVDGEKQGK